MVLCVVFGCSKRSGRDKDVSFYRVPKVITNKGKDLEKLSRKRRAGYLSAIRRADLTEKIIANDRICSRHFLSGKPASLLDDNSPDWLPTLNLGHTKQSSESRARAAEERWERAKARESLNIDCEVMNTGVLSDTDDANVVLNSVDVSTQTDLTLDMIEKMHNTCEKNIESTKEGTQQFTEKSFVVSGKDYVRFYVGLPNFEVLRAVFDFVAPPTTQKTKLTQFQEFVLTLIKLRLDLPFKDLGYRFGISATTVSRIFSKWLTILDARLSCLIMWPDRDSLWKTMPQCFRSSFGKKVAVILDCFEVFMDRPSSLLPRASTWSNYKHHNTVKILLGVTPQGTVSFVSEAWGGRVSDKYLTESCGILQHLLPGDVVLADRGFDISESVGMMQARLHIPAFTRGKTQLTALEVEDTRTIANVRIHVERVIGVVRQKYSILRGILPIEFVTRKPSEDCPHIDKIVRVCCSLCNLCDSVVPFD